MTRSSKPKVDTPKPLGRPTKLTPDLQAVIVKAIKAGATHETAALSAGIARSTFYDWKAKGEAGDPDYSEFSDALKIAEAQGTVKLLERIQDASFDPKFWQAAAWILERRYPETYGRQRIEHTGKDGEALTIRILRGQSYDAPLATIQSDEDDS